MNPLPRHHISRVLHLENHPKDLALVRDVLEDAGITADITPLQDRIQFASQLVSAPWDIILISDNLSDFSGPEAVTIATTHCPDTPTIVVAGSATEATAVECLRLGADEYVLKDRIQRLPDAIKCATKQRIIKAEARDTEVALRESQTKLNAIAQHSRLMLYTRDERGRFNYANPQAELFLGEPLAQLIGNTWLDYVPATPDNRRSLNKLDSLLRSDTTEITVEMEISDEPGKIHWIEVRENVSVSPAGVKSIVGVALDITDRKSLEAQLRQTQRLENLGLLAAGVAHDFNNVLSPIMMAGPLLRPTLNGTRHERLLTVLESSATRGAALVKQVLAFARGDDNKREALQIKHILRDVVSIIQETFPKNITCEERIPTKIPAVRGNATQLHQVLLNLCVNARDAMPAGGTLSLSLTIRKISEIDSKEIIDRSMRDWVVITVADTGTGIPPELLTEIWNPFFTTKSKDVGTGLGLNTVRGIITAHHGTIALTSKVGQGSSFEILLPAIEEKLCAVSPQTPTNRYQGNGERILIVDDEPLVRDMLSRTLRRHNYRISVAADGVEALKVINLEGSDLRVVITDIHMPQMSGDILISVLRKLRSDMKIVASSGHPARSSLQQCAPDERPDLFVAKPFEGIDMLRAVHELIASGDRATETSRA